MNRKNGMFRDLLIYLAVAAYIALTLAPMLSSGFYADDLVNSTLRGGLEIQGTTFFQNYADVVMEWIRDHGRLFPLGLLTTRSVSYLAGNLLYYKIVLLLSVLASSMAFGSMVRHITGDKYVALLAMLLLPVFFQFRLYHDPILSYSGFVPIFVLLTMCAMIFYAKYLKDNSLRNNVLSLVFYNLTLYYSEISLPMVVLFWIMTTNAYHDQSLRFRIRKAMPHVMSAFVAAVLTIVVKLTRDHTSAGYDGIQTSFQFVRLAKTFLKQLYASFPLSYYLGNPFPLFNHDIGSIMADIAISDYFTVAICISLYIVAAKNMHYTGSPKILVYLGLPLLLFPTILIAITSKYQQSLRGQVAGVGYIYVYIQYFGVLLMCVALLLFLLRRLANTRMAVALHSLIIIVLSATLLLNNQCNRTVVDKANIDLHHQREALVMSLKSNILHGIPENSHLLILDEYVYDPYPGMESDLELWDDGYPWINEGLIYQYSGRRMHVYTDTHHLADLTTGAHHPTNGRTGQDYALIIKSFHSDLNINEGFVELVQIENITVDGAKKIRYQSRTLKIYFPENIDYPDQDSLIRTYRTCYYPLQNQWHDPMVMEVMSLFIISRG